MAHKTRKTYRSFRPAKVILTTLLLTILTLILLTVAVFFGFKKYIVYTTDGLRLDIPWLEEDSPDISIVTE